MNRYFKYIILILMLYIVSTLSLTVDAEVRFAAFINIVDNAGVPHITNVKPLKNGTIKVMWTDMEDTSLKYNIYTAKKQISSIETGVIRIDTGVMSCQEYVIHAVLDKEKYFYAITSISDSVENLEIYAGYNATTRGVKNDITINDPGQTQIVSIPDKEVELVIPAGAFDEYYSISVQSIDDIIYQSENTIETAEKATARKILNAIENADNFAKLENSFIPKSNKFSDLDNTIRITAYDMFGVDMFDTKYTTFLNDIRATIKLKFQDKDEDGYVDGTDWKKKMLSFYRLNEQTQRWERLNDGINIVNKRDDYIQAETRHFSIFAFMPRILSSGFGEVTVSPNPVYFNITGNVVNFRGLPQNFRSIKIFNIAGELVREFRKDDMVAGKIEWIGDNSHGAMVSSGIYLYILVDDENNKEIGKLGVIK